MPILLALLLFQTQTPALENEYVRVTKDAAPCASAERAGCSDRVIVALGNVQVRAGTTTRSLARGQVAVFKSGESYSAPTGGPFYEVAFKADHPPVQTTGVIDPPDKNVTLYDGPTFFIFEERLEVGDTRDRHAHSQRVVFQLNRTRLQQWPEGQPELMRDIEPDGVAFNPPVIHTVKNVGTLPLRGIVIELKPSVSRNRAATRMNRRKARKTQRARVARPGFESLTNRSGVENDEQGWEGLEGAVRARSGFVGRGV